MANQRQLTPRQKSILLYGGSRGLAGRGFLNEGEELQAWCAHRAELLATAGSAGRPAAYFKFELGESTPYWIDDVHELFRRGVLKAPPRETASLAADQRDELHLEFSTVESIRAIGLPVPTLESICREMGQVLAYMKYRGRPALIEKYVRIHAAIRQVLRESLSPLRQESIQ